MDSGVTCDAGSYFCNGHCAKNDPTACGPTCTACTTPSANGFAVCLDSQCIIACNSAEYTQCGTECVVCPADGGVVTSACDGNACVAQSCLNGYRSCGGTCALCPEPASATSCSGTACVATACSPPFRLDGGSCAGLRYLVVDPDGSDGPTGAAHTPAGGHLVAWQNAGASGGMKIAFLDGGGFSSPATIGTSYSTNLSFAVDSAGGEHASFVIKGYTNTSDSLQYATRLDGGAWQEQTVLGGDGGTVRFPGTAIAVTTNGDLRLVFEQYLRYRLGYLERNNGVWTTAIDVPPIYAGGAFRLAVDAMGTSHILVGNGVQLSYVTGNAAGLSMGTPVVTSLPVAAGFALALDSQGAPAAAWVRSGVIKYRTFSGGLWSAVEDVSECDSSTPLVLGFDSADHPYLAFLGQDVTGRKGLRFGARFGTAWVFETVFRPSGSFDYLRDLSMHVRGPGEVAITGHVFGDGIVHFAPR